MRVIAGISSVLYHITTTASAAQILGSDRFELKPSEGTSVEEDIHPASYYLSTARTISSKYIRANAYPFSTILVLNGRGLAARLPGKAVDYWGPNMRQGGENFESEDRIFSPSPTLPNAHTFITAIHSLLPSGAPSAFQKSALFQLLVATKRRKIPTFWYTDRAAFRLLNTRKSTPLDLTLVSPEKPATRDNSMGYLSAWLALWEMPREVYFRLLALPEKEQRARGLSERMIRCQSMATFYPRDVESFIADLHNAKSTPYGSHGKDREALDRIIAIMRRNKLTPKAFYSAIGDKFRRTA